MLIIVPMANNKITQQFCVHLYVVYMLYVCMTIDGCTDTLSTAGGCKESLWLYEIKGTSITV